MITKTDRHLHIISFNIPFPPDYGGVIDVFYKIRWLYEAGVKIHLHSYIYNRPPRKELEKYCESVHYYNRKKGFLNHFSRLPFIVFSRRDELLLNNLINDGHPVLFEGLHTCYYLNHSALMNRIRLVRTHNIEHIYYRELAKSGAGIIERIFYILESVKLWFFERRLRYADQIFSISPPENEYFRLKFRKSILIPPFHSFEEVMTITGKGEYILLHGNLSVAENVRAIKYLMPIIRKATDFPVIIAGKEPGKDILQFTETYKNIRVISSPEIEEMHSLIRNAHIIILHTFQSTGIKLKLIESIYLGRFIVANSKIVAGTGFDYLCEIADTKESLLNKIKQLIPNSFDDEMLSVRKRFMSDYSNERNAEELAGFIYTIRNPVKTL